MRFLSTLAAIIVISPWTLPAGAVSEQDQWQSSYRFATTSPRLVIENIWGDVLVRGVPGDTITVKVSEHRSARDQALLERSRELIYVEVIESDGGVELLVGGGQHHWRGPNRCRSCRVEYRFEVEAPFGTNVSVSTVNDGQVRIEGIHGLVAAGNVNGPVTALDLAACESLSSVNGDVRAEFSAAPSRACRFDTINGDLITVLPANAGIDLRVQLGHGRVYSQFDIGEVALPAKVERIDRDGSHIYRIEQPAGLRVGAGGPQFSYESLNGDIRINRSEK